MRTSVVVAGALAQRPGVGGHAWVFLNWLVGLRELGYDVTFLDRLDQGMLDDPEEAAAQSRQWQWLRSVMGAAGLEDDVALVCDGRRGDGRQWLGMHRSEVLRRCRRSAVLLNFMGYLDDEEVLGAAGLRVFVDIDPGFPQFWHHLGLYDAFAGHEAAVTVGLGVGQPGTTVPDCGREWITTVPPVALSCWGQEPLPRGPATVSSVCTWRGPNGPLSVEGVHYGLRAHEFRRFAELPGEVREARFELALAIDPADARDRLLLKQGGWRLVDPVQHAGTPQRYRHYLRGSTAEFMVAKGLYVTSQGGWFSDRSACYLATGRPVVAQETGFGAHLPTGKGLLTFTNPDQAAGALEEVCGNLGLHAAAARDIACEHFDAARVLPPLLSRLGIG